MDCLWEGEIKVCFEKDVVVSMRTEASFCTRRGARGLCTYTRNAFQVFVMVIE